MLYIRERLSMLNANPSSAPRVRMPSRLRASCSRRRAVFLRDVLGDVLPLRRHLRIELERLEMNVDGRFVTDAFERRSSDLRPITHQGQETSDTKSILSWASWTQNAGSVRAGSSQRSRDPPARSCRVGATLASAAAGTPNQLAGSPRTGP